MKLSDLVRRGYPGYVILDVLARQMPEHADKIKEAQDLGYSASTILKHFDNENPYESDDSQYMTEHEQIQERNRKRDKKNLMKIGGAALTAATLGAGAYGMMGRGSRAVYPTEILGGPGQAARGLGGPKPPQGPMGLPGGAAKQLPGPANVPRGTPTPPMGPLSSPPSPKGSLSPAVNLVKNLRAETQLQTILQSGHDIATTALILKQVMPRSVVQILEKSPGGLENVVEEYTQYLQTQQPVQNQQLQPQQQEPELPINNMMPPVEAQALQEGQEMVANLGIAQVPTIGAQSPTDQKMASIEPQPMPSQDVKIDPMRFAIPSYRMPGESKQDFTKRHYLNKALDKAAKATLEGKDFRDFLPLENKELARELSTAKDVLRMMAGIPNVYDSLLTDEEKNELSERLIESGKLRSYLRPTKGEQNVYGAIMPTNAIWNLMLAVDPKIKQYMPSSVKKPGKDMDSTEMRRYVAHALHAVLDGKGMSPGLSEKISKISQATAHVDSISKAAKAGNTRKLEQELLKLAEDDERWLDLMQQELEYKVGDDLMKLKLVEDDYYMDRARKANQRKSKKQKMKTASDEYFERE